MFEKEAKEYTKENLCKECHHHCTEGMCTCTECKKKTFKDGAEFGYNKANEWHFVKDGDLPKVNELVLIKITGCFVLGWTNGVNWFNDSNNGTIIDRRMVIAWKEIVLPELPKECHDCVKFDEIPKGTRSKTCDDGSHFQKKEAGE